MFNRRIKKLFWISLVLLFNGFAVVGYDLSGMSGESLDRNGYQWAPYIEWSLENTTYSDNPYDLIATVTFVHSLSGETCTTGMFYDNANTWKFRFTGSLTGTWTFTTSSSDADLDGHSGAVTISANPDPDVHGFVTKFDNKWGWMGTNNAFVPQFVMYDHPKEYYNNPNKIDADIDTFLVAHGFNGFHTFVACRWFDINEETSDSLGDDPNPDSQTFEALELLITKTHEAGGLVHVWMWGDSSRHQTPDKWGKNGIVDQRLQRYIAARLGPLPGWTMGYGFDCIEWVVEEDLSQWHSYMHDHFGWPHFLGARSHDPHTPSDPVTQIYEGLDHSGYEQWKPTYDEYIRVIDARPTKPSFSEDRFRIRTSPYPWKDYTEEETRRGLYHSTMAGGVANIWCYALDGYTAGWGSKPYPHKEWIKTNSEFFKNRFIGDMVRDNGITDGVCLKRPANAHYIFYKEDASQILMDLSGMDGLQPAVAVDTKLAYSEIDLGSLDAVNQIWTAPYISDWAVAVGNFGSGNTCIVQTKVFLEGPYNSGTHRMSTALNENGCIPTTSPYPENPRSVSSIPDSIVDWVLVELRNSSDGWAVTSKSVFLHRDGHIVGDDGTTDQITMNISEGSYYIVVNHRNHLSVMSANAIVLSSSPILYDFVTSSDQFYGTGGCQELEAGVWGMYGGNSDNSDQDMFPSDLAEIKTDMLLGSYGYKLADTDMDGDVFPSDYGLGKINMLIGVYSTVPNP